VTDSLPRPKISLADLDRAPTSINRSAQGLIPNEDHEQLRQLFVDLSTRYDNLLSDRRLENNAHEGAATLNKLIVPFASRIYWFMCSYCAVVAFLVCLNKPLSIPEKVLDFLVGSTAVTVFGLIGTVLTGIFSGVRSRGSSKH